MGEDTQQLDLWASIRKKCAVCEEEKSIEEFGLTGKGYTLSACKECLRVRQRTYEKKQKIEREQWVEKQAEDEKLPSEYTFLRVCANCGKEKVANAFKLIYPMKDGVRIRTRADECDECANVIALQKADYKRAIAEQIAERERTENSLHLDWEERRKAKHRKDYDTHLRARYGKTIEEYEAMLKAQEGKCAICRKNPTEFNEILFVDHSHVTGTVRGLLCQACNFGLGWFQDNTESIQQASEYLSHWDEWKA